jgi:drug/metabolite transporter (DMT)-like permease
VVGLALLNFEVFNPRLLESFPHPAWGMVISLVCLVLWSVFAVLNSRFVKRHADVHLAEWTSVLGVYSGLTMLVIFLLVRSGDSGFSWKLIVLTGVLGVFSTFIATRLWNYASRVLPASLCAQLIVSETVFALLYGFIYEWQWPTAIQWTSMILLISGVCIAVQAFRVKQNG